MAFADARATRLTVLTFLKHLRLHHLAEHRVDKVDLGYAYISEFGRELGSVTFCIPIRWVTAKSARGC